MNNHPEHDKSPLQQYQDALAQIDRINKRGTKPTVGQLFPKLQDVLHRMGLKNNDRVTSNHLVHAQDLLTERMYRDYPDTNIIGHHTGTGHVSQVNAWEPVEDRIEA